MATIGHDDGRYVVVASNAGSHRHPAWWLNLEAGPDAEVVVDGLRFPVHAHRAEGSERDGLWARAVEWNPVYAGYAAETARGIPVVVLEPVSP